ncbi:DUF4430 domain-containing protein [Antribacter gilvus]|uniref:DUF4430 domain-containing protein n=1 Tax=Antribacter gilvus TaxID=2304675 RepID=UPI001F0CAC33|nr:DUF4430 domain-containing protein [Antribacter gilvus]
MISTFRARTLPLALTALLTAGLLAGCSATTEDTAVEPSVSASADASASSAATDEATEWSYAGETGRTALELLLESDPSAEISGEGEMAYVTGIDGRVADQAANEFWALYVDGEMATVGAGALVTEDGQEITWKLETF